MNAGARRTLTYGACALALAAVVAGLAILPGLLSSEDNAPDEAAFRAAVKGNDMLSAADPKAGQATFNASCFACHPTVKGEPAKMGPNLYGIVGSRPARRRNFDYSPALRSVKSQVWTTDELYEWLHDPAAYAPGTKMKFVGLLDPQDRMDLIAYLMTLR